MYLTPNHTHAGFGNGIPKLSFGSGKSKSTGELRETQQQPRLSSTGSSPTSVQSLDLSWNEDEQRTVDRIQNSRRRLEDEIEVG